MKRSFSLLVTLVLVGFAVVLLNCGDSHHPNPNQLVNQFAFAQYTGGDGPVRGEVSPRNRHNWIQNPQQFLARHSRPGNGLVPAGNIAGGSDNVVLLDNDGSGSQVIAGGLSIAAVQESADGKKGVASAGDDNGYMQIYFVDLTDKKNPKITQLTSSHEYHMCPQLSWDASKIIYMKYVSEVGWRLFLINSSGGSESAVQTDFNGVTPSFTPDGRILFEEEPSDAIWIMHTDGTGWKQLTNLDGSTYDEFPSVSPDGKTIVFDRYAYSETVSTVDIWSTNIDGTNLKQLTTDGHNADPMFVNNKIVFVSWRDQGESGTQYEIYSMSPDGSKQTRLTNNNYFDYLDDWFD